MIVHDGPSLADLSRQLAELQDQIALIGGRQAGRRWMTYQEAADYTTLSRKALQRLVNQRKLTIHHPVQGRSVLDRRQIDAHMESCTARPKKGRGGVQGRPPPDEKAPPGSTGRA